MNLYSHSSFLYSVFIHSISAVGGPQGHYLHLLKNFVEKRNDLSEKELFDYNAFCQLLPGASSTQLLVLIAYRRGGLFLAITTLVIWILPAALIMGSFALLFTSTSNGIANINHFRFLQPMAIGFIGYASIRSIHLLKNQKLLILISIWSTILCLSFYKSPWIFPIMILSGATFVKIRQPQKSEPLRFTLPKIKWFYLTLFVTIFIVSGTLSELSKKRNWNTRPYFNLFENCYRFGSLVFGGGDVLIPMMYEQYVARPTSKRVKERNSNVLKIQKQVFLSGAGVVRSIPGPVFSFSSFAGGAVMQGRSYIEKINGIILATIAIFLPSFLIALFFFPLWQYLQQYSTLLPLFQGIHAATLGIMFSSTFYLTWDSIFLHFHDLPNTLINFSIVVLTIYFLIRQWLNPYIISLSCLLLGIIL